MFKQQYLFLILIASICTACSQPSTPISPASPESGEPQEAPAVLTVMTHDSFSISEEVVAAFEAEHSATVKFLEAGDTGTAVNKAILSADSPLADVFYGIDNTFLSRALQEDIFEPYASPLLEQIPDSFELDPQAHALPVDYGDVCLNYDKAQLEELDLEPPQSLDDLLLPAYRGMLVVENPATSSPGLAFLLATIGKFGQDNYLAFWQGLVENDVLVVNDWNTAYYSEFSRWGGSRPIVVSYGSSPPAEVYFSEEPIDESPTAAVVAPETCFRQIEFVGILKGTENRELAQAWIDFMLSPTFQSDLPLHMFVFPVNPDAQLPEVFVKHAVIPEKTAIVEPTMITQNREAWIQAWTETVLR
jgi:thiamine transport system substrate-binding protein